MARMRRGGVNGVSVFARQRRIGGTWRIAQGLRRILLTRHVLCRAEALGFRDEAAHGHSASCFAVTSLSIKAMTSVAQKLAPNKQRNTNAHTGRVKSSKTDFHPANDMRTRLLHGGCLTVAPRCAHFVAPFPRKACDSTASGHVHSQSAGEGSTASHAPSPPQRTLHKHEPPTTRSPTVVEMFTTKHRRQMRGDFSVCRGTNATFPIGCIHHASLTLRLTLLCSTHDPTPNNLPTPSAPINTPSRVSSALLSPIHLARSCRIACHTRTTFTVLKHISTRRQQAAPDSIRTVATRGQSATRQLHACVAPKV
ncbi:hypothetical protein, conserved in T.vivax [Trypanosoma vivax Y486]|uniref:Uncharacterized protein n=1 Tax=Trypanosoma vivax (strain Y486) TaxID=1055687 RepID=F9WS85_TRYVY|nr:hypothetical protein, conserved in T.vivax [Trypanosoma vivax Y486]|eukprot:CCD20423.1 hypothetical protein, conserved in T.vivax [Trypanosoma vivax Y486]